jgi:Domain of unknown function (DUF6438)
MKYIRPCIHLFLYSILSVMVVSCSGTKNVGADKQVTSGDSLAVYLEKGPCFGTCPMYSVSIYNTGYIVYEGKLNVERIGKYSAFVDSEFINKIMAKADELNYWDLNEEYIDPYLTDFPTIKSELNSGTKQHKVTRYTTSPPENLIKLEDYIDSLLKSGIKWTLILDEQSGPNQD